jgi:hypothetical protein
VIALGAAHSPECNYYLSALLQEQIRVLTQRKVELAAAEEAAKASPEDQKEVRTAQLVLNPP